MRWTRQRIIIGTCAATALRAHYAGTLCGTSFPILVDQGRPT
jgi:hypothetical protein